MTDEQLDLAIARFLDWRSQRLDGAPDAYGMTRRLGGDRPVSRTRRRTAASAIVAVALLVLLAVGMLLVAGALERRMDPLINGRIVVPGFASWRAFDPATGVVSSRAACNDQCPDAYDVRVSPDGRSVYFVDRDRGPHPDRRGSYAYIQRWDRSDDVILSVAGCLEPCRLQAPMPSPDGRYLAYVQDGATVVIDVRSGHEIQRFDLSPRPGRGPYLAWDPTGRLLVLRRLDDVDHPNLRIDVETGTSTEFRLPRPGLVLTSPDASTMALVHADRDTVGLSVLDPGLVDARLIFEEASLVVNDGQSAGGWPGQGSGAVAPDGTAVAILVRPVSSQSYELRIVNIATGAVVRHVADPTAGPLFWLPAD